MVEQIYTKKNAGMKKNHLFDPRLLCRETLWKASLMYNDRYMKNYVFVLSWKEIITVFKISSNYPNTNFLHNIRNDQTSNLSSVKVREPRLYEKGQISREHLQISSFHQHQMNTDWFICVRLTYITLSTLNVCNECTNKLYPMHQFTII